MLTIDNISYHKNQKKILENIGFSVGLGTCLLLTGKNGSGKTTLLKIIAGLLLPNKGKVLWNGQNIQEFYSEFSSDIKYLGHKNFLKQKLTVKENLSFFTKIHDSETLIPSAIKYFGLDEIADLEVQKLSAGMQKRVMLSLLLCCPATVWILDEPTINLDKEGKELLFNLINIRIKESGIVFVATHDEMLFSLGTKIELEDFIIAAK